LFTDDVEETFSTIDPDEEIIQDYIKTSMNASMTFNEFNDFQ